MFKNLFGALNCSMANQNNYFPDSLDSRIFLTGTYCSGIGYLLPYIFLSKHHQSEIAYVPLVLLTEYL